MKITLLAVGSVKGVLAPAVRRYMGRIEGYWTLRMVEVDEGTGSGGHDPASIRGAEGERIARRLPDEALIWALTRKGKGITSRGLARYLERLAIASHPGITFVVGGAFGLDDGILERADRALSLSPMSLPHDLARLVLLEQIYRAGTIRRGEPYHKGP